MIRMKPGQFLLLALALLIGMSRSAHAAESYDNCTGFITSIPAVITASGTWCLKKDLTTAMTSGAAITIATNNVTIDCNDFKLGGLAAGAATEATGIYAADRRDATVRHCNIRGFSWGLDFSGVVGGGEGVSGGHVVEDNRFEGNTAYGIIVTGDGSVIRRNLVLDTGGSTAFDEFYSGRATGIFADYSVDVLNNTVSGVAATVGGGSGAIGIVAINATSGSISGNRVRGLLKDGAGAVGGILINYGDRVVVRDNDLVGDGNAGSFGLKCDSANGRAMDNVINGFATGIDVIAIGIDTCSDDGNIIAP